MCLPTSTATHNIDGDVLEAISRNPCVKIIHIPKADHRIVVPALQARTDRVPEMLRIGSGKECALCVSSFGDGLAYAFLRSMVSIMDFPINVIKENPGLLPDLPDKIWEHILRLATEDCVYNLKGLKREDQLWAMIEPPNRTRRNILLVSKRFHVGTILSRMLIR